MCLIFFKFVHLFYYFILFYFSSFTKKKETNKNKQKERWQGQRNSCGQLQEAHSCLTISFAVLYLFIKF